jgi:hypothetical protein
MAGENEKGAGKVSTLQGNGLPTSCTPPSILEWILPGIRYKGVG